uniref:FKBP prolyl isomerase 14 n=1 Tax=Amphiprion percula TaxID=161767 RepID=A0A3P8TVF1_AMPPE
MKVSFSSISPLFLNMEHVNYNVLCSGKIPPESTLTFIIEVLEIRNGPRSHESFQEMDLNDDWRLSKQEVKTRIALHFSKHEVYIDQSPGPRSWWPFITKQCLPTALVKVLVLSSSLFIPSLFNIF